MIKVSVAIGTYNRFEMVRQAIYAALNQTFLPYEIIVFDDCSPDGTYEKLSKEFIDHEIVKIYSQRSNTGGVPNWNSAVDMCSGDIIAWCSDDDRFFTWHLSNSVNYLNENPNVGLVHSAFYESYESELMNFSTIDNSILESIVSPKSRSEVPISINKENVLYYYLKYYNWPFHPSTFVFRRSIWQKVGGFNPKYEIADIDWFFRVANFTSVVYLPSVGVLNRRHLNNWSNKMGGVQMQVEQYEMITTFFLHYKFSVNKVILMYRWKLFFDQLLLRIFISRSRAGIFSSAYDAIYFLRKISILKYFPKVVFDCIVKLLFFILKYVQNVCYPNSSKYKKFGLNSPK